MKARNKASYLFITFFLLLSIMASSVHAEVAFLPYVDYGTDRWTVSVASGDFNNDGKDDLATLARWDRLAIFLADDEGSFTFKGLYGKAWLNHPFERNLMLVADVNNDGNLDIVYRSYVRGGGKVSIVLGNGDGSFKQVIETNLPPYFNSKAISAGDLNGDGNIDIVAAGNIYKNGVYLSGMAVLLFGDGEGGISGSKEIINIPYKRLDRVNMGDVDKDGDLDIVLVHKMNRHNNPPQFTYFTLLKGDGEGDFEAPVTYDSETDLGWVFGGHVRDVNNDGNLDIIVNPRSGNIITFLGDGTGDFNERKESPTSVGGLLYANLEDINCDGNLDIINARASNQGVRIAVGSGDGTFALAASYYNRTKPYGLTIGDFNGDGKSDIATANYYPTITSWPLIQTTNDVSVLLNAGPSCGPPITADAGPDQVVEQTSVDGAEITLDGSGSEGDALDYHWTWSGGGEASGVSPTVLLPEGDIEVTLTVTSGTHTSDPDKVTVTVEDTIPPSTSVLTSGTPGNNGWYVSTVNVSLLSDDSGSGVKEIHYSVNGGTEQVVAGSTASITIASDGPYSITYWAVDNAGNVEGAGSTSGKIDRTAPAITVTTPAAGDYLISEVLTIGFSAVETGSGLAYTSATLDGQAVANGQAVTLYTLAPGSHTFVLSSEDNAGNQASKSVAFNIIVTADSLSDVIDALLASGEIDNGGVANSLKKQLENGNINALLNHIDAQDGKHISGYAAELLRTAIAFLN